MPSAAMDFLLAARLLRQAKPGDPALEAQTQDMARRLEAMAATLQAGQDASEGGDDLVLELID